MTPGWCSVLACPRGPTSLGPCPEASSQLQLGIRNEVLAALCLRPNTGFGGRHLDSSLGLIVPYDLRQLLHFSLKEA